MSPMTQLLQIGLSRKYDQVAAWVVMDHGDEKKGLLPMGLNFLKEFAADVDKVQFIDDPDIRKSYKEIHEAVSKEHPQFARQASFYMIAKLDSVWAVGTGKNSLVRKRAASTALALTLAQKEMEAKRMQPTDMEEIIKNYPEMHTFCVIAALLDSDQPDRKQRRKESSRPGPGPSEHASGSQPDRREVPLQVLDTKATVSDKTVDVMVSVHVEGYGDVRLGAVLPAP